MNRVDQVEGEGKTNPLKAAICGSVTDSRTDAQLEKPL
jgi:hypothetical protein